MAEGNPADQHLWRQYDSEFHHALISAFGSQVLLDTDAAIYDKYLRYLVIAAVFRGDAAAAEHHALLTAALGHDWQSAQARS